MNNDGGEGPTSDDSAAGTQAADQLYRHGRKHSIEDRFTTSFAESALQELSRLIRDETPGLLRDVLEGATFSAEQLNVEGLTGLVEILQNADDEGAHEVRFLIRTVGSRTELLVAHDGARIGFVDTAAMALAYVSTKRGEAASKGKFGIGLKTLSRISTAMAVHCHPYHFEAESDGPRIIPAVPGIPGFYDPEQLDTLLVLALREEVSAATVVDWFSTFDAGFLLFLDAVSTVRLFDAEARELDRRGIVLETITTDRWRDLSIEVDLVRDPSEDRYWTRYSTTVRHPTTLRRAGKETADEVPIAVAVPSRAEPGRIHAGLPIALRTRMPYALQAQFDPDTARSRLQHEPWNAWLIDELARLVSTIAVQVASATPALTWEIVPLADESFVAEDAWLQDRLRKHIEGVHRQIAESLLLPMPDGVALQQLAYEVDELDGVLTAADIAELAPEATPLANAVRDPGGRWRLVLDELAVSKRVDLPLALTLLEDERHPRPPAWYADLVGAALAAGLGRTVATHRCAVLASGARVRPPQTLSQGVLVSQHDGGPAGQLLHQLGFAWQLHPEFLGASAGEDVTAWLKHAGTLHSVITPELALQVIADHESKITPSDSQLTQIRDLLAAAPAARRDRLAPALGQRLLLAGFSHENGSRSERLVTPPTAYLPSRIEGGSAGWAPAAGTAAGLLWIDGRYSALLRPTEGGGLGARAFLSSLGAEVVPRLTVPRQRDFRRDDPASPIHRQANGAMQALAIDALKRRPTHLQADRVSADLDAVVAEIVASPVRSRRERARGLLATISRGWRRVYADHEFAHAVYSDYRWKRVGPVPATWLSRLASAPWMSNMAGEAKAPRELAVRTPEMLSVFGEQPEWYAAEVDADRDLTVLHALGMKTSPTTEDVLRELTALRDTDADTVDPMDAVSLYLALAQRCPALGTATSSSLVGELTVAQLRGRFGIGRKSPGLLYWHGRWYPPSAVYRGDPIFGSRRPFVPEQPQLEPLWEVLALSTPKPDVCFAVLNEIAQDPPQPHERGVLLQVYRYLSRHPEMRGRQRDELRKIPLQTVSGWQTQRPIYAVDDRALAEALGEHAQVWIPPGGLDSFGDFPSWAGVITLDRSEFALNGLTPAAQLAGVTVRQTFEAAVRHLHDMILAEDPDVYAGLSLTWAELIGAQVALTAHLSVEVQLPESRSVAVPIGAHVSRTPTIVAARTVEALRDSETGGLAIAALFGRSGEDMVDRTKVALLWEKAWRRAERGEAPENIQIAVAGDSDDSLADLAAELQAPRKGRRPVARPATPTATDTEDPDTPPTRQLKTSVEVDVAAIEIGEGQPTNKRRGKRPLKDNLPAPKPRAAPRTAPAAFTQDDVETFGLELLRETLRVREIAELTDFRNQHGIGADAVDELLRYFEIKAHAREMPDEVSLTAAESHQASRQGNAYFLAVIAGLERGWPTRMRIFKSPLTELEWRPSTTIHLGGIRTRRAIDVPFTESEEGPSSATGDLD